MAKTSTKTVGSKYIKKNDDHGYTAISWQFDMQADNVAGNAHDRDHICRIMESHFPGYVNKLVLGLSRIMESDDRLADEAVLAAEGFMNLAVELMKAKQQQAPEENMCTEPGGIRRRGRKKSVPPMAGRLKNDQVATAAKVPTPPNITEPAPKKSKTTRRPPCDFDIALPLKFTRRYHKNEDGICVDPRPWQIYLRDANHRYIIATTKRKFPTLNEIIEVVPIECDEGVLKTKSDVCKRVKFLAAWQKSRDSLLSKHRIRMLLNVPNAD